MKAKTVSAPVSLITSKELTASSKVLWLVLTLGPGSLTGLAERSGLTRKTVLHGLNQLSAAGWYSASSGPANPAPDDTAVTLPIHLLSASQILPQAKLLYGMLQLTPAYRKSSGHFTYKALRASSGLGLNTIKRAVIELIHAGWLQATQEHQRAPIIFTLTTPQAVSARAELAKVKQRLKRRRHFGEGLMKEYLNLLVDSKDFEDNVAPSFLVNPQTGERLELDRFYRSGVAFEFQGPQHFGPTEKYSAKEAAEQMARDYIKQAICQNQGVHLQLILPEDLDLKVMQAKIGNLLPLRDLTGYDAVIQYLEYEGRQYRRKMRALMDRLSKAPQ